MDRTLRAACERRERRVAFRTSGRDNASTLRSVDAITGALEAMAPRASLARGMAAELMKSCDAKGRLPDARREEATALIAMIERALHNRGRSTGPRDPDGSMRASAPSSRSLR